MGYLQDEEVVAGLHAGARSTQSYRSMRLQMVMDAHRKGEDGLTLRERAQERGLAQQVGEATAPGAWRSINEGAATRADAIRGTYTYVHGGQMFPDARAGGSRMLESIGDRWHRTRQGVVEFGAEIDARANAAGPSALGEVGWLARGAVTAIAVTHDRLSPDGRYLAYRLAADGHIRTIERQEANDALPPGAISVPIAAANLPRLLRQGYAVQQHSDQTVTIWQTDPTLAAAAAAAPEQQFAQLAKDGALLGNYELAREAGAGHTSAAAHQPAAAHAPIIPPADTAAPTAPGTPSRVERLAAGRRVLTVDAAPLASPASTSVPRHATPATPAVRRRLAGSTLAPGAAPPRPVEAAPPTALATSTGMQPLAQQVPIAAPPVLAAAPAAPPAPAALPAPAARWLAQVQRQTPQAASAVPAAPAQPAHTVSKELTQEPATPASVPGAGATDTPEADSEK